MGNRDGLSRFVTQVRQPVSVATPKEVARYLIQNVYQPIEAFEQEEFWVLILSARQMVTHSAMISRGTVDSTVCRPADVYREAVRLNARSIVVAHNHPSGEPEASSEDQLMTQRLISAGRIIDINLVDHVIVATGGWYSLKEQRPQVW